MRWFDSQAQLGSMYGQKRIRRKFLFLPRNFGGHCRWLEKANIVEEVRDVATDTFEEYYYRWVEIDFAEEHAIKQI